MKEIAYFPGCTLTETAKNYDVSAREAMKRLGVELKELPRWNCCGTVYSLASDNLMNHVAPIRIFVRTRETGATKLVTLCSMCYNTLKRSNLMVKEDSEKLERINSLMDREEDYTGDVEVVHLLEVLRDDVGFPAIKKKVTKQLEGLTLASYYGCLLVRPKEIAIDKNIEAPTVMDDLMIALGAKITYEPFQTECCGSYHAVKSEDIVSKQAEKIIRSALKNGAEAIVTGCPLCHFNLDEMQKRLSREDNDFKTIPILYFTQLLGLALGLNAENCFFNIHHVDPGPLLKGKNLI